jgi:hypothetical protein
MTEFSITIDAAPGSGVDVDRMAKVHDAAQANDRLIDPIVIAHGDDTTAQICAKFTLDAESLDAAAANAADWFGAVEGAGVPAELALVEHLEVAREFEHYAA